MQGVELASSRIFFKSLEAVDEVRADDRIATDADAGALPNSLEG